jgi:t-SNARE complex subunit (syntaxin)
LQSIDENELEMKNQVRNLTKGELDREIAELSNDVDFLESQVQADLKSYSSEELETANRKIAGVKRKLEFFKKELARRK